MPRLDSFFVTPLAIARPRTVLIIILLLVLAACAPESGNTPVSIESAQSLSAQSLQARVEAAIAAASDLPQGTLGVEVRDGVVTIRGDLSCADCGGTGTPGGTGTVQQSLGAVVRAVPGVQSVEFDLE